MEVLESGRWESGTGWDLDSMGGGAAVPDRVDGFWMDKRGRGFGCGRDFNSSSGF